MKLAEALILRADLQKRIEQLKNRLRNNVMVQEGDSPSEDPEVLLKEFEDCQLELTDIIKRINKTNNETMFNEKWTLADALAERDGLWEKRLVLSYVAEEASIKQDRYSRTEIKYISTVNVKELQKEADKLSKEYRELDKLDYRLNLKSW